MVFQKQPVQLEEQVQWYGRKPDKAFEGTGRGESQVEADVC